MFGFFKRRAAARRAADRAKWDASEAAYNKERDEHFASLKASVDQPVIVEAVGTRTPKPKITSETRQVRKDAPKPVTVTKPVKRPVDRLSETADAPKSERHVDDDFPTSSFASRDPDPAPSYGGFGGGSFGGAGASNDSCSSPSYDSGSSSSDSGSCGSSD